MSRKEPERITIRRGFATIRYTRRGGALINIHVDSTHQGLGIERHLLMRCIEKCRQSGATDVQKCVDGEVDMYILRECGFVEWGLNFMNLDL